MNALEGMRAPRPFLLGEGHICEEIVLLLKWNIRSCSAALSILLEIQDLVAELFGLVFTVLHLQKNVYKNYLVKPRAKLLNYIS